MRKHRLQSRPFGFISRKWLKMRSSTVCGLGELWKIRLMAQNGLAMRSHSLITRKMNSGIILMSSRLRARAILVIYCWKMGKKLLKETKKFSPLAQKSMKSGWEKILRHILISLYRKIIWCGLTIAVRTITMMVGAFGFGVMWKRLVVSGQRML